MTRIVSAGELDVGQWFRDTELPDVTGVVVDRSSWRISAWVRFKAGSIRLVEDLHRGLLVEVLDRPPADLANGRGRQEPERAQPEEAEIETEPAASAIEAATRELVYQFRSDLQISRKLVRYLREDQVREIAGRIVEPIFRSAFKAAMRRFDAPDEQLRGWLMGKRPHPDRDGFVHGAIAEMLEQLRSNPIIAGRVLSHLSDLEEWDLAERLARRVLAVGFSHMAGILKPTPPPRRSPPKYTSHVERPRTGWVRKREERLCDLHRLELNRRCLELQL